MFSSWILVKVMIHINAEVRVIRSNIPICILGGFVVE